MSDKKNFSVLGKIDERYVEEADVYSVSPETKNERGRAETSENRRSKRRKISAVCAGIAAGVVLMAAVCYFGASFVSGKDFAGMGGTAINNAALPEHTESFKTSDTIRDSGHIASPPGNADGANDAATGEYGNAAGEYGEGGIAPEESDSESDEASESDEVSGD